MTCIAFDGQIMAADSMATNDDNMNLGRFEKIYVKNGMIIGMSGTCNEVAEFVDDIRFHKNGFRLARHSGFENINALVVHSGQCWKYDGGTMGYKVSSPISIGCGRQYAMAAMHLGKNAPQAVRVAIALDCKCGGPVDWVDTADCRIIYGA